MKGHVAAILLLGSNGLTVTSRLSDSVQKLEELVTSLVGAPTKKSGKYDDPKFKAYWETFRRDNIDWEKVMYSKKGIALGGDIKGDYPDIQVVWIPLDTTYSDYVD